MFGDSKLQELLAATSRLSGEVEALRQRCAGLEAQLQAHDPQQVRDQLDRLAETLQAQESQIVQLKIDNVALSQRLEEEVRQARQTSTALFQRVEQVRSGR